MEIQTFGKALCDVIKTMIDENSEVFLKEVVKANDVVRQSIVIREANKIISPTVYIDSFYEQFKTGQDIESIANEVIKTYKRHMPKGDIDVECLCNYEKAKENLFVKLINTDKNKRFLDGVISKPFLDLSAVVYYSYSNISDIKATVTIRQEQLKIWNVSADEVLNIALKNTREKLGCIIEDMEPYFVMMMNCNRWEIHLSEADISNLKDYMYCMTNMSKHFGASCMMYEDKLEEFAKARGTNLFIIPSSVHEVLIVPDKYNMTCDGINDVIKEINKKAVEETEILSDHVYYFEIDKGFRQII